MIPGSVAIWRHAPRSGQPAVERVRCVIVRPIANRVLIRAIKARGGWDELVVPADAIEVANDQDLMRHACWEEKHGPVFVEETAIVPARAGA